MRPGSATSWNNWSVSKWKPACGSLVATIDQIAQTENPICSATIDQIRLRRAMNLPLDSQNFSSSGFQSAIQLGFCSLIRDVLFKSQASLRAPGKPQLGGRKIRMIGFQGRRRWRQNKLFKLCASRPDALKRNLFNMLF